MMNFQIYSEELPLLESTRLSSLSSVQNDSPIANEEVNILSLSVGHPNISFVPSPLAFHHDQGNDHYSSTFNGLLDDTEESNVSNLDNGGIYPDFSIPENMQESSLDLSIFELLNQNVDTTPVFQVITKSSQKGKDVLIEKVGYAYVLNLQRNMVNYWRCSVRNKYVICPARVTQRGNIFTRGSNGHNHQANPGKIVKTKLSITVRNRAKSELFVPAAEIVETALVPYATRPDLPSIANLARAANRARQSSRPEDPVDLDFEINTDYIPEISLRGDVKVDERRHLIFATNHMLNVLCRAKIWYLDGTFKIVKEPFTQLFSIHAFVKSDSGIKQLPLVFVLMSGKRKKDYRKVLKVILEALPSPPVVQNAVMDFELSLWKAFPKVYPGVEIRGCSFHWTQAVWRKIQFLGLQQQYINDISTHDFCRKLMALPFLPAEHIEAAFRHIEEHASSGTQLELVTYINDTWILGNWNPKDWSIFNQAVRTNNDVEGWHLRINTRARRGQLQLYLIIELLHKESQIVTLQMNLVSQNKLKRYQRKTYKNIQAEIMSLWEQYSNGAISVNHMLRACSRLNGPQI